MCFRETAHLPLPQANIILLNMLTLIDVEFLSSFVCSSENSGYKRMFIIAVSHRIAVLFTELYFSILAMFLGKSLVISSLQKL